MSCRQRCHAGMKQRHGADQPQVSLTLLATAAVILVGGVAACGSKRGTTNTKTGSTVASTRTVEVSAAAPPQRRHSRQVQAVKVARTTYGRALVDRRGFALYLFTHDRSADSTCYGACAAAWPPYVVATRPARGGRANLVGSVRRRDGRLQVTYAGRPLYYYVGDRRPGEVLCQAVSEYGGTWYIVSPDGRAIR